jgi:hypothetical protein
MTYAANERRDQGDASFCASYGLTKAKEKCEVAVNTVILLEFTGCLNTFPG